MFFALQMNPMLFIGGIDDADVGTSRFLKYAVLLMRCYPTQNDFLDVI